MIHAYNEIYLDDAMITLAELFSYVNTPNDADVLFDAFINSGKSFQFERGNCRYLTMPSHALFNELVDYVCELPNMLYNHYCTDTLPAGLMIKGMLEHIRNISEVIKL